MTALQKGTVLSAACLTFVFALSVGLAWYGFGQLDWPTVGVMGLMLAPVLAVAAILVMWADRRGLTAQAPPRVRSHASGRRDRQALGQAAAPARRF